MWRNTVYPGPVRTFESERLLFRNLREQDGDWYLDVLRRNRQHIASYMPDEILALEDVLSVKAFLGGLEMAWKAGDAFCFGVWDKESDAFVAQIYIQPVDRPAGIVEIGYFADIDQQGRGYVAEAVARCVRFLFTDLHVHKICLVCDEDHERSRRIAETCGFRLEGVLFEHALNKDGRRPNRCHYGMTRGQFDLLTAPLTG